MDVSKDLVQHIAVFGGSGSGKTVLLSSFYGAAQEPQFLKSSLFHVVADDIGQGTTLHRNYLGMRDSARVPPGNHFSATSYAFSLKFKDGNVKAHSKPFDGLRLIWHDYPGEWFEQDVSGPEEAQRRIDTFKSLLISDVALLLVDGHLLLENSGQEEAYLKSLFTSFKNGLLSLKDQILTDGKPLVEFPRVWIVALSKADLLPGMDVYNFRDLLIDKAGDDLNQLREVLAGLVEASDALSVGEDFLLLSSAKFGVDKIEVTKRVGLDLILPVAAILPFERLVGWGDAKKLPPKLLENLLGGAAAMAPLLIGAVGRMKLPGAVGLVMGLVFAAVSPDLLIDAAKLAGEKLEKRNAEALAKHDHLTATLTGFKMDLEKGEDQEILIRSHQ